MRVLDDFIDKFIICKKCHKYVQTACVVCVRRVYKCGVMSVGCHLVIIYKRNPETYVVIQDGLIDLHCKSCSGRTPVDMRHKLSTFILKNPPPPLTAAYVFSLLLLFFLLFVCSFVIC